MVGGIILTVVLVVLMPVGIMMSGTILAALLGETTKNSVDADHEGSELLEISKSEY